MKKQTTVYKSTFKHRFWDAKQEHE